MTLAEASKVLLAFVALVPPGEAWKDRGINSASVFPMGEGHWTLVICFSEESYFKYIPNTFGCLQVTKRTS